MKHQEKLRYARSMMVKGDNSPFTSKAWLSRKARIAAEVAKREAAARKRKVQK
jgi:hypothetical protein